MERFFALVDVVTHFSVEKLAAEKKNLWYMVE
jgi:hypothetical protein